MSVELAEVRMALICIWIAAKTWMNEFIEEKKMPGRCFLFKERALLTQTHYKCRCIVPLGGRPQYLRSYTTEKLWKVSGSFFLPHLRWGSKQAKAIRMPTDWSDCALETRKSLTGCPFLRTAIILLWFCESYFYSNSYKKSLPPERYVGNPKSFFSLFLCFFCLFCFSRWGWMTWFEVKGKERSRKGRRSLIKEKAYHKSWSARGSSVLDWLLFFSPFYDFSTRANTALYQSIHYQSVMWCNTNSSGVTDVLPSKFYDNVHF